MDDHPLLRQGLSELINRQKDLRVCGQAATRPEALDLAAQLQPDLTIIDVSLKGASGLDLVKALKIKHPRLPILVLSMHDENLYAERALRAGARGYIMKEEASEKILTAIYCVLKGGVYLSSPMKERMLHHLIDLPGRTEGYSLDRLSDRELEVYQLLGNGFGTRQVAEKLGLSVKTIESYRESLKEKMGLRSGAELVRQAVQWIQSEKMPG